MGNMEVSKRLENSSLVEKIVEILKDKKARDIDVINISNVTILADYFILCSGTSTIHIRSMADELKLKLEEQGIPVHHVEGYGSARWILMDYGNVVVHIFHEEERKFYSIERLWADGIITRK